MCIADEEVSLHFSFIIDHYMQPQMSHYSAYDDSRGISVIIPTTLRTIVSLAVAWYKRDKSMCQMSTLNTDGSAAEMQGKGDPFSTTLGFEQ